jgi:hypothetical protein
MAAAWQSHHLWRWLDLVAVGVEVDSVNVGLDDGSVGVDELDASFGGCAW